MIGLVRIVAALKAVEPRHWFGLGASVALHLGVLLGWKPEPPPEPKPVSFEIVLEPTPAQALPAVKEKALAKKAALKKLAKQRKAKPLKLATKEKIEKETAKREPNVLDATWQGESKVTSQDAPALALPDAPALGLTAGIKATTQEIAKASGKPQPNRAERETYSTVASATSAAASESSAGLSEPGMARASTDNAPRGETGLALAQSTALAANQGIIPGTSGAGAQASTSASSLAGAPTLASDSQRGLHASAAPQAALNAPLGVGMQAAVAAAVAPATSAATAGAEPQGVRLTASGTMAGLATVPAGAGSVPAGTQGASLAQAGQQHAPTYQSAGGTGGGRLVASQAGAASGPVNAVTRSGSAQAGFAEAGVSRRGRGQEATGRLGAAAVAPTALMGGARVANAPGRSGQGGETAALAPGEPGSSPNLAVALQPVLVGIPASNPYLPTRPGQAGAGASGAPSAGASRAAPRTAADAGVTGGASMQFAATATGTGPGPGSASGSAPGVSHSAGGTITTPGQAASAAVLNAAREAGRAPVVLQAAQVVPVKVVRPDTEIQRLDVLAPSNYCPLPIPGHNQPDNRAPQPDRIIAEQPAYALDNPRIDYPFLANIRGVEGRVTVRVEVLANGRPGKMWLKQSSGSGILDQDAQVQLMRWRFVPARKFGQPVAAWIDVPVLYRLSEARP